MTYSAAAHALISCTSSPTLSCLMTAQVLAALSVRGGCGVSGHVPYRDSKLTQLLWDGLRGGGRAAMLACLSPLRASAEESLNTLRFAAMALRISSHPVIITDPQVGARWRGMHAARAHACMQVLAGRCGGACLSCWCPALPQLMMRIVPHLPSACRKQSCCRCGAPSHCCVRTAAHSQGQSRR